MLFFLVLGLLCFLLVLMNDILIFDGLFLLCIVYINELGNLSNRKGKDYFGVVENI